MAEEISGERGRDTSLKTSGDDVDVVDEVDVDSTDLYMSVAWGKVKKVKNNRKNFLLFRGYKDFVPHSIDPISC